jgi:hypothetical protein
LILVKFLKNYHFTLIKVFKMKKIFFLTIIFSFFLVLLSNNSLSAVCYGTPNACSSIGSQTTCTNVGCSWDAAGPCTGTVNSCTSLKRYQCCGWNCDNGLSGCTINGGSETCCGGTADSCTGGSLPACSAYSESVCTNGYTGCTWDAANCYDGGVGEPDDCNGRTQGNCVEGCSWDSTAPTMNSLTVSSSNWKTDGTTSYTITATATDNGVGMDRILVLVNYQGANAGSYGGYFSWKDTSYTWSGTGSDQVVCTGSAGGYGSKNPSAYGYNTITLNSCTATQSGGQVTVVFTVTPNSNFPELAQNDISFHAQDDGSNVNGWTNYDLNFLSDGTAPTKNSLTISSDPWKIEGSNTYTITAVATDTVSGVDQIRTLINLQGDNSANTRGYFGWDEESYVWAPTSGTNANRTTCTGGGYASKDPDSHGYEYTDLISCSTSESSGQRTVNFVVRPKTNWDLMDNNDISFWALNNVGINTGWSNYDLNFESIPYEDIGLKFYDGSSIQTIMVEPSTETLTSALKIRKDSTTYGIVLVDLASAAASNLKIQTSSGIKAFAIE